MDGSHCSDSDESRDGVYSLLSVSASPSCLNNRRMGSIADGFRCSAADERSNRVHALPAVSTSSSRRFS